MTISYSVPHSVTYVSHLILAARDFRLKLNPDLVPSTLLRLALPSMI